MHEDTAGTATKPSHRPTQRFRWHKHSHLFDAIGKELNPAGGARESAGGGYVRDIFDADPVVALRAVYDAVGMGQEFCLTSGAGPINPTAANAGPENANPMQLVSTGEACFQCMSSGTSGAPRRVRRSQKSWIDSFEINAALWQISEADSYAVLGRFSHSLALYGAAEALHLGADLHLLCGARPDRQMRAMAAGKVTILYATPTQIRLLGEAVPDGTAPSLRALFVGGAKLDAATRNRAMTLFPNAAIHEFYGASETSFITLAGPGTPEGSVGRAYAGVEISVRDDSGRALADGQTGEVWVRSPYLFCGYATGGAPGDTQWDAGWLTVGEFGWRDSSGALYLAGRRGRMVTIADQNAFPEEVETCLMTLEGVARAAVLPKPDIRRGHVFAACVQLDGPGRDPEELITLCRAQLGPLKAPRTITLVENWPTLPSGKTDLAALDALIFGARP